MNASKEKLFHPRLGQDLCQKTPTVLDEYSPNDSLVRAEGFQLVGFFAFAKCEFTLMLCLKRLAPDLVCGLRRQN